MDVNSLPDSISIITEFTPNGNALLAYLSVFKSQSIKELVTLTTPFQIFGLIFIAASLVGYNKIRR